MSHAARCALLAILPAVFGISQPRLSPPAQQTHSAASQKPLPAEKKPPNEADELQRAVNDAGADHAALLRNLENFLRRFPDTPYKASVLRAIVESSTQVRDFPRALEATERLIAIRPDDTGMMLLAIDLLERAGEGQSLTRAVGYATRILDHLEKQDASSKPDRISSAEWELEHQKLKMSVYLIRGRLEMARRNFAQAAANLQASDRIIPNAAAAVRLGEIAEIQKDYAKAIDYYAEAFVLPESSGAGLNHKDVRRKLGNVWRLAHGSDAGLGEYLLAAYDRMEGKSAAVQVHRNAGLSDPFAFVLRRPGAADLKLADWTGKVLVLNFWATWCLPCRDLEPLIEEVMRKHDGQADVSFLGVNTDEDEGLVQPYVQKEKIHETVVFEDGLGALFGIRTIPTVLVLDRSGKIIFRADGYVRNTFAQALNSAIEQALRATASP